MWDTLPIYWYKWIVSSLSTYFYNHERRNRVISLADWIYQTCSYEAGLLFAYLAFVPFCEIGVMDGLSLRVSSNHSGTFQAYQNFWLVSFSMHIYWSVILLLHRDCLKLLSSLTLLQQESKSLSFIWSTETALYSFIMILFIPIALILWIWIIGRWSLYGLWVFELIPNEIVKKGTGILKKYHVICPYKIIIFK